VVLGFCLNDMGTYVEPAPGFAEAVARLGAPPAPLALLVNRSFVASFLYFRYASPSSSPIRKTWEKVAAAYQSPNAFVALVMDLDLPQRDARSIARLIREAGNEQDLAIVVLASAPSPGLRAELRALGVDAVVDRRDGPAVAVAAALEAVAARGAAEEIELETWRYAPATPPLGETSLWSLGGGELAGA